MERSYVDFDLEIETVGAGYRARVLESPAGQAHANFTLPFSPLEIENFVLRIGQRRRGVRRVESRDLDTAREFGGKLFQAVVRDDIAGAYRSSILSAHERNHGLRVRLRLSGAPDLVDIPWEFLFDPSARRFVALSADSPIVRFLDLPGTTTPLKIEPPIKLLVVIASPSDFEPLQVEEEWARLSEAVGSVEGAGLITLERLNKPTLTELQRALRRNYHVLHFVGHGGFDEKSQDGLLVFEDEQGRGNEVSATYLSTLLHDADSLRLAVLNACDGARSSRHDQFAGVAQSLLQQGVPAVVAMQFEISDEAALTFAREFYGAFAEGFPVEAALAEARKSMFAQQNDSEWATPVLYLRSPGSSIFEIAPLAAPPAVTPPVAVEAVAPLVGAAPTPTEEDIAADVGPPQEAHTRTSTPDPAPVVKPPGPEPEPHPEPPHMRRPEPEAEPATVGATGPVIKKEAPERKRQTSPWAPKADRDGEGGFPLKRVGLGLVAILALVAGLFYAGILGDDDDPAADDSSETPTAFPTDEAGNPITPIPDPGDFSGKWSTNFASMTLEQDGTTVKGSYFLYLGGAQRQTINGTVEGNNLYGFFDGNNQLVFTLDDDEESFNGYWLDAGGKAREWCGQRDDDELKGGCGYSGNWKTKGLPVAMNLDGDTFWVTHTGDSAFLELKSLVYGDVEIELEFDPAVLAKAVGTVEMSASNAPTLRFQVTWLVADEENWDSMKGTWKALLPSPGADNTWCAWRGEAPPPC